MTRKYRVFKGYLTYLSQQGFLRPHRALVLPALPAYPERGGGGEERAREETAEGTEGQREKEQPERGLTRAEVDSFFVALDREYEDLDSDFRKRVCLRDDVMMRLLFYHGLDISKILRLELVDYDIRAGVLSICWKRDKRKAVDAWYKLGEKFDGRLVIAGFKPDDNEIDFSKIEGFNNVTLKLKSLSDKEYLDMVDWADYVVFPYSRSGNSGVLSTIVSMGKVPITTSLPSFTESGYVSDELLCQPDDVDSLSAVLEKAERGYLHRYKKYQELVRDTLHRQTMGFDILTRKAYKEIDDR